MCSSDPGTTKSGLIGSHDRDPLRCQAADMTKDQRQDAPANTAETNEDKTAVELRVDGVAGHDVREPT